MKYAIMYCSKTGNTRQLAFMKHFLRRKPASKRSLKNKYLFLSL